MRVALAVCQPLAAAAQVDLAAEAGDDLPQVPMDRNRILQVFQNLLENAIQHAPPGSRVVFRAEPASLGEREAVRFSIEDSGPGFRAEDLPHLFEPFFTRRRGGTGLGLSIVQRIVEQHEGEITAANRPEGGAVVSVLLACRQQSLPKWERVV
jgi:signal transduction histidine kinase